MPRTGRPPHADQLTPAEWRVVEGVRHGLSNPTIAKRLGVSVNAVKFHVGAALSKLGLADRRALRKWGGVRAESNFGKDSEAMGDASMHAQLCQIAYQVTDIERAVGWFSDTLGIPLLFRFEGMAFFDANGVRLYVTVGDPSKNSLIYFRVADLPACIATLSGQNVEIVSAPHRIHVHGDGSEEWLAIVNDPDGAPVGLMSVVKPPIEGGNH